MGARRHHRPGTSPPRPHLRRRPDPDLVVRPPRALPELTLAHLQGPVSHHPPLLLCPLIAPLPIAAHRLNAPRPRDPRARARASPISVALQRPPVVIVPRAPSGPSRCPDSLCAGQRPSRVTVAVAPWPCPASPAATPWPAPHCAPVACARPIAPNGPARAPATICARSG